MLCGYVFVIFNVYLLVQGISSELITRWSIKLLYYHTSSFDIASPAIVVYNKPFKIVLEQYAAQIQSCSKNDDEQHVFPTSFESDSTNNLITINVANATVDMSTTWRCQAKKQSGSDQSFTFKVRVTGLVTATVGRFRLTPSPSSDLSALSYDDISIYNYTNGEDVDMVCQSVESGGDVLLVHYSGNGTKLIETDPMPSNYAMEFRKKMRIEDNNTAVDCTYMTRNKRDYTHRISFKLRAAIANPFNITVAGLELVPTVVDQEHQEYVYQYRYFKTQKVPVSCELNTNSTSISSLSFEEADMDSAIRTGITQPNKRTIKLKTAKLHNKRLKCKTRSALTAYIHFGLEPVEPQIQGLSATYINRRYRKNSTTWVIDYWSPANRPLDLKCANGAWIYEGNTEGSQITFTPQQDVTSMTCVAKKKDFVQRIIMNLSSYRRKPEPPTKASSFGSDASELLFGCAAVVSIAVITVVSVILYRNIRRRKNTRQGSLRHLTREIEAPISSYPPQWEHASNNHGNQGVILNNYLYDTNDQYTPVLKKPDTEDHVYHYPVVTPSNVYAVPIKTIKRNSPEVKPSGESSGSNGERSLLRSDEGYASVHDVIKIKRTSEYVEPAYSVIHHG